MADPVAIAPGVRNAQDPAPRAVMSRFKAQAAVAYLKRVHAGDPVPVNIDETVIWPGALIQGKATATPPPAARPGCSSCRSASARRSRSR